MQKLYCPECGEYLEGGDGSMRDCLCGWRQPEDRSGDSNAALSPCPFCGVSPDDEDGSDKAAARLVRNSWISAYLAPPLVESDRGWLASAPVLARCADGRLRMVTLEQFDEDEPPQWYSDCSEHWSLGVFGEKAGPGGVIEWLPASLFAEEVEGS